MEQAPANNNGRSTVDCVRALRQQWWLGFTWLLLWLLAAALHSCISDLLHAALSSCCFAFCCLRYPRPDLNVCERVLCGVTLFVSLIFFLISKPTRSVNPIRTRYFSDQVGSGQIGCFAQPSLEFILVTF